MAKDYKKVGIEKIDNTHDSLITIFNDLHDNIKRQEPENKIENVFEILNKVLIEHFHEEEKYMKTVKYPYLQEHLDFHRKIF